MNDYKELIEQLNGACIVKVVMKDMTKADLFARAADTIEQLIAENAKLKAERDAAMRTMPHDCNTCSKDCNITIAHKALFTKRCDEWEWRGVEQPVLTERRS